jgi:release factor glutamine methyltransferase
MANEPEVALTWGAQLIHAARLLARAGSPAPQQEAAELLGHLLGMPVTTLAAHPATPMRQSDIQTFASWVARRIGGVPTPYITGHLEFMGLDIAVGWESPLPLPGAQRLVEEALRWARLHARGELSAAEMGTGCGAVSLALAALEPRFTRIYALDASMDALAKARVNGARYLLNLVITWLDGRDLATVPEPVDLVICGQRDLLAAAVERLSQAPANLRPGGALICAIPLAQRQEAEDALRAAGPATLFWVESAGGEPAIAVAQFAQHTGSDDVLSEG